jgi:hypothetical protein
MRQSMGNSALASAVTGSTAEPVTSMSAALDAMAFATSHHAILFRADKVLCGSQLQLPVKATTSLSPTVTTLRRSPTPCRVGPATHHDLIVTLFIS